MNKLFFSFWWRHFGSSRHMDNSWVVLPTTGAQNQRSTQKQSGGGRGWETKDKFDWITEGGQGIFKCLLGELHIFVFAWLSAAEKPIMGRFAPHESLGAYTCSDCPHSRYKQIKRYRANLLEDLFQVQHCQSPLYFIQGCQLQNTLTWLSS